MTSREKDVSRMEGAFTFDEANVQVNDGLVYSLADIHGYVSQNP